MKYITRTTKMTILPEGDPIFSEQATHIEVAQEAAGDGFLKITQDAGDPVYEGSVCIDHDNWPAIKAAIETMLEDIKKHEQP